MAGAGIGGGGQAIVIDDNCTVSMRSRRGFLEHADFMIGHVMPNQAVPGGRHSVLVYEAALFVYSDGRLGCKGGCKA